MNKLNRLIRIISVMLISVAISSCGGGGGGGGGTTPNSGGGAGAINPINLSGGAVKGIIKNGIVNIYGVTGGVQNTTPLVSGRTNPQGKYSLTVPNTYSGPIVVIITSDADTVMVCDVVAGCGNGVLFGEDVTLAAGDLELKAVVPAATNGETISTNVTTLTSMAAERSIAQGISETSAQEANSQVANLFGITGNLIELEVIDITDPAALVGASTDAQQAALVSAAILSKGIDSGKSIQESIDSGVNSFNNNNGQLISNELVDSNAITLEEIYGAVQTIVTSPAYSSVNLGALQTRATVQLATAKAVPAGMTTMVQPSTPAESTAKAAARALVSNIRRVGLSATFEDAAAANTFAANVEMATTLVTEDSSLVIEATSIAIDAILTAMFEADGVSLFTPEGSDIEVSITGDVYTVNSNISIFDDVIDPSSGSIMQILQGIVDVSISMTGSLTVTDSHDVTDNTASPTPTIILEGTWVETFSSNITAFSGTAGTENTLLTINNASKILLTNSYTENYFYEESRTNADFSERGNFDATFSVADIVLNVSLAQLSVAAPVSFNGELGFLITGPIVTTGSFESSFTQNTDCGPATNFEYQNIVTNLQINDPAFDPTGLTFCVVDYSDELSDSFGEISFNFSGEFSQSNTSFNAALAAQLSMPEGFSFDESYSDSFIVIFNGQERVDDFYILNNLSFTGETTTDFVGGSLSLAFTFNLPGVDPSTSLMINASRTGLESATTTIALGFNGNSLSATMTVDSDNATLNITDQSSSVLRLSEMRSSTGESTISGSIIVNSVETATITVERDVLTIRYGDGDVEIL